MIITVTAQPRIRISVVVRHQISMHQLDQGAKIPVAEILPASANPKKSILWLVRSQPFRVYSRGVQPYRPFGIAG